MCIRRAHLRVKEESPRDVKGVQRGVRAGSGKPAESHTEKTVDDLDFFTRTLSH